MKKRIAESGNGGKSGKRIAESGNACDWSSRPRPDRGRGVWQLHGGTGGTRTRRNMEGE